MSCDDFQILLNRDLDGILGTEDEKRLSAHVAGCPKCRANQASAQAIHAAFRDLRHVDASPGLADRIIERASAPRAPLFRIPRYAMVPIAASVLALCLISGALGWRLREPTTVSAGPEKERRGETAYRRMLTEQLGLTEDKVEAILAVRRDHSERLESIATEIKEKRERVIRSEMEEVWKLLPSEVQVQHPELKPR